MIILTNHMMRAAIFRYNHRPSGRRAAFAGAGCWLSAERPSAPPLRRAVVEPPSPRSPPARQRHGPTPTTFTATAAAASASAAADPTPPHPRQQPAVAAAAVGRRRSVHRRRRRRNIESGCRAVRRRGSAGRGYSGPHTTTSDPTPPHTHPSVPARHHTWAWVTSTSRKPFKQTKGSAHWPPTAAAMCARTPSSTGPTPEPRTAPPRPHRQRQQTH